jgi:catechol 2,3-dioxygenase-like lactoylglutathione lyase family enzyme
MTAMTTYDERTVTEMRLVVTTDEYDEALRFYRDVPGLPQIAVFDSPRGQVTLLGAGRATLELTDPGNASYVAEVEVGRRVTGPFGRSHRRPRAVGRGFESYRRHRQGFGN